MSFHNPVCQKVVKDEDCIHMSAFDMWPSDSDMASLSSSSSSPPSMSFSFGYSSTGSTTSSSFASTRRSSNVSPVRSTWSEHIMTPPVTPRQGRHRYMHTPATLSAYQMDINFPQESSTDVHTMKNNIWMPYSWQQPLLPVCCPETPTVSFIRGSIREESNLLSLPHHANDPVLSHPIFADTTYGPLCSPPATFHIEWPEDHLWSSPLTVDPRRVIDPVVSTSPVSKVEHSSPVKLESIRQLDLGLDSSSLPVPSMHIVKSQRSIDELRPELPKPSRPLQPTLRRRVCDGGIRKSTQSKALTSAASKPIRAAKSGPVDIVSRNTFECSITGCGRRFKRQEHKKRHEETVPHDHKGNGLERSHSCWVCERGFTRSDNLKSHIQKTHGRNSAGQRNRYVATLDPSSKFYDPEWRGKLTDDGYPLVPEVTFFRCGEPGCEIVCHLAEKLKTHVLHQHGKKASGTELLCEAGMSDSSDLFTPEWEIKIEDEEASL